MEVVVEFVWHHSIALPRKPPATCKNLGDISTQTELLPILPQISLLWQQGSVVVEFFWRHSIARPSIPPDRRKNLGDILLYKLSYSRFCAKFQQWTVVVDFFWHHSIARPQKPPAMCKNLGDISRTSWVIAYFVSNFVAMASGVSRGRNCLTSFNSTTTKTPIGARILEISLIQAEL